MTPAEFAEYKRRREAEMAALIAERNRGGERAVLRRDTTVEPPARAAGGARRAEGEGGSVFADEDAVGRVALATETPIKRLGWFGGAWIEILDMDGVRMDRVKGGLPMLAEHGRQRLAGVWKDGAVDADRVLRARPVFSRNAFAREVRQDVLDGIRSTTSIGYAVHLAQLEEVSEDGVETWRFADWEPLEGSWEVVPADLNSGVGRSARPAPAASAARRSDMTDDVRTVERSEDGDRAYIQHLATMEASVPGAAAIARRAISEGRSKAWAREQFDTLVALNPARPTTARSQDGDLVGASERELRDYRISRAIAWQSGDAEPGLEAEYSRALEPHVPENYKRRGGVLVPAWAVHRRLHQRAGLDSLTEFKGREGVFTQYEGQIDLLRSRAMVLRLGATYLPGLSGHAAFVRQTAAAVAEWVQENPGSDQDQTELALDLITLIPKTLQGSTFFSRQLMRMASVPIEDMVQRDLAQVHARALDRAAVHGTGADNQPEGIYVATGVNAVPFAGVPTFELIVAMETAIAEADGDVGELAYLTTPGVRGLLRRTRLFADSTDSLAIWTGGVDSGMVNGYRAAASTQVRSDLGATPTPADHGFVFGYWPACLIGEWGLFELIVDPYSKKRQGLLEISSFQMVDIRLRHAEQFSKATGLVLVAPE